MLQIQLKSKYKAIGKKTSFLLITFSLLASPPILYAAMPASTNYALEEYTFGAGGTKNSTSENYGMQGVLGEIEFGRQSSETYALGAGLTYLMTAETPPAPTFTNPDNYYNKLKLVINAGGNPTDTTFAIAVSPDNFSSTTTYVQADMTLGNTPVWQTYTAWGGSNGMIMIGLTGGTTYTAKVAARHGNYTQTNYGPTAQAATISPTLSFNLTPHAVNIGQLTPQTVITSPTQITTTVTTNGTGGAVVYVFGSNNGLLSSSVSYTINSSNSNLASAAEGYGLRSVSTTQSSGGPLETLSPYNGTGDVVGALDTTKRPLFDSSNQPITSGQGIFELKAKASTNAKPANDYTDILTVIASATF